MDLREQDFLRAAACFRIKAEMEGSPLKKREISSPGFRPEAARRDWTARISSRRLPSARRVGVITISSSTSLSLARRQPKEIFLTLTSSVTKAANSGLRRVLDFTFISAKGWRTLRPREARSARPKLESSRTAFI